MNDGKTPDELAHEVVLPADLAADPLLGEYYGNVSWSVRAIYSGILGWFDGNPAHMRPGVTGRGSYVGRGLEQLDVAGGPPRSGA
ncbi:MAG: hypothetical protein OXH86_18035 [Acidimicrobiaceae bacterium]|nr:hypothetical protein [Acidimicrobiaceae bacterium]